ncbi:atypical chemokine receptor 4b [Sphaeramia orbicularis]|uniref:G-protein coupled receptors family 1 profile domain-containing protein n=1 Tax=Sphaeramia orbicularis TaxID=375764 RepID=A0A673CSX7_9TELE|nr:atypical chemokine receptor 4 [Sphaeramia orbicularis]XP_029979680.1 atypical chemokine receptor 4 [Sphaeramia orbicularis]
MEDYEYHDHDDFNDTYDYDYHTVCDKETVRSFGSVFLPVIYAVALVVGLAGNALVVVVYTSRLRLRTLTDMCILNLAISDLLLLFTLPFWAADAVHGWRLGSAACKFTSFLYSTNFSCGMLLLACISVDRYRAVAQMTGGRNGMGPQVRRQWVLVCVGLWAAASFLGLPELIFSTVKHSHHRMACTEVYPPSMARPAKAALELLEVILRFLLPFLVMVVCYCWVGRALSRAAGVRRERKWRALRVLLAVVAVFLLTQLPYNVVKLCRALDVIYLLVTECEVSKGLDRALQITESLALSHACINPLLYAFMGSSFRGHVLKAAKHFGQRISGHPRNVTEEPAVEIALNNRTQTQSHSGSEDQDTSTFTI